MRKNKKKNFQAPKGMVDILPEDQVYWEKLFQIGKNIFEAYGFSRLETPILEETDLFIHTTGESTDIVEKQMYSFRTKGGDYLSLRPEGTPGVIRAYLEHGFMGQPQPVKFYYFGPFFRYEQPQAGRLRQFHQFGLETIGSAEPVLDAQIIYLFFLFLKELGLKNIGIQINSLGCSDCRKAYRRSLLNYYRRHRTRLCSNCQRRIQKNPLRLLDCQDPRCQILKEGAPQMIDYLCSDCREHFKNVLEFLDDLGLPYFLNHYLVRGLDYYTRTVFEIWPEEKSELRQAALASGGRYDNLVELLGGRSTPAVGGAAGLERIILLLKERGLKISSPKPKIFLIQLGKLAKRRSLKLFEELRKAGIRTAASFSRDSLKSQLKLADKTGVRFALILGQKETLDNTIIIRDMSSGVQEIIPLEKIISHLKKRLREK